MVSPEITQGEAVDAGERVDEVAQESVEYLKFVSLPDGIIVTETCPFPAVTDDTVGVPGRVTKLPDVTEEY